MSKTAQQGATICLGAAGIVIGQLSYEQSGAREHSSFVYAPDWLGDANRFNVSPDLSLLEGHQYHKKAATNDSAFHAAIADTEADGWGRRVINRDFAKRRRALIDQRREVPPAALTEWDYLIGVDDFSRVGALRLRDTANHFLGTIEGANPTTPPLLELGQLLDASQAVERGAETEAELRYLRGRGTSLGGLRPKCTVVDNDGHLAIGKFPSVADERNVTKGEVLALHLAKRAGINAAEVRIEYLRDMPVAVIRRFDRTSNGDRIPYLSAASMLQARREDTGSYTEIAEQINSHGANPRRDLAELWRRIVFNLLITNVDDHLRNHGFLHVQHGQWRLAPAFDMNPFPDKDQELKTSLTEESGPVADIVEVVSVAARFGLKSDEAKCVLGEVYAVIQRWRAIAVTPMVGMTSRDLDDFSPAFEHKQMKLAAKLLGKTVASRTRGKK